MRLLLLWWALSAAPEVSLPPKKDVVPTLATTRPEHADAIRAGVKAALPRIERCRSRDGGAECVCAALKQVRFDVMLDGGTLMVSYPLQGGSGPSFTLDASGRIIDCRP